MNQISAYKCEICGTRKLNSHWFLVKEDRWRATLEILQWDAKTASESNVGHACSAAHVEQLVSYWVTYGGLNYNNTRPQPQLAPVLVEPGPLPNIVGKLTVDRSKLHRGLETQPGMLATILDAIDVALQTTEYLEHEEEREQDFKFDA
jgi:hypothetical protein